MNEKTIKQNAEEYADSYCSRDDQNGMWQECCNIFIAGARSRNDEIKDLMQKISTLSHLIDVQDRVINDLEYKLKKM